MEKLYTVITPLQLARVLRRGRLRLARRVILEPKYDGYLLVAHRGKLCTILGRRAPGWMKLALFEAGIAEGVYEAMKDGFSLFIEVYGRRASPNGYHRRHNRDYDAVVIDIGFERDEGRMRLLPPEKASDIADYYGLPYVEYREEEAEVLLSPPKSLAEALPAYRGWEGYVAKAYSEHGHTLPTDYGARMVGMLAVKARWETLGRLLGRG